MFPHPRTLIPHRPPVLCIDEIASVSETSACATRVVPVSATHRDTLWEPWLVEGLAQTAAVLHGHQISPTGGTHVGMLVGVRRFKILHRPSAGDVLRFEVEVIKRIAPLTLIQGRALVGDRLVARGELKFFVELAR